VGGTEVIYYLLAFVTHMARSNGG
jgi:hypothetical protein